MALVDVLPTFPTRAERILAQRLIGEAGRRLWRQLEARREAGDPRYQVDDYELLAVVSEEEMSEHWRSVEDELRQALGERAGARLGAQITTPEEARALLEGR